MLHFIKQTYILKLVRNELIALSILVVYPEKTARLGVNSEQIIRPYLITAHHQGNQALLWFAPSALLK